ALPPALRDQIVAHAKADAPKEACGLIAGHGAQATRLIRCANAHPAPVSRYAIDPVEQIRAFRDMDATGEELVAIYHSHPITQPYPSPIDQKEWHYPDALLLVLSLRDVSPELCAFRVRDGWVREVKLT